jgi:hypothetical protein
MGKGLGLYVKIILGLYADDQVVWIESGDEVRKNNLN